jgi:hypothetical protein
MLRRTEPGPGTRMHVSASRAQYLCIHLARLPEENNRRRFQIDKKVGGEAGGEEPLWQAPSRRHAHSFQAGRGEQGVAFAALKKAHCCTKFQTAWK